VKVGNHDFPNHHYDAEGDVLYLHADEPAAAQSLLTAEGHLLRFALEGPRLVGVTVFGARALLERDGALRLTVPQTVELLRAQVEGLLGKEPGPAEQPHG